MKQTTNIQIDIQKLRIDQYYYSFEYSVYINGKLKIENEFYQSDHVWGHSKNEMKKFRSILKNGEAVSLVLERISQDDIEVNYEL